MVLNERTKFRVFSLTNHKVCVLESNKEKQMWVCLPGGAPCGSAGGVTVRSLVSSPVLWPLAWSDCYAAPASAVVPLTWSSSTDCVAGPYED